SLDWLRFMHTPNDYRVSQKQIAINRYLPNKKSSDLLETRGFFVWKVRCVRDSNSSRNPFCTNILFNQVFKVQRLIQREEFAVLLSFDRLNWNNAKIVKNNNMTKFRYITHCFFEVFVLS
uniref:hypothetical protein n=1 Tax=Bacteroides sp. TaxID=29523 RepID=UPI00258F5F11